jgi:hypothetical protein
MGMHFPRTGALLAALAVSACGSIYQPNTAIMPDTAAGTPVMSDQGAIGLASYALASPSRTAGDPGEAARALASVDYLAGALYSNPHWVGFPAIAKIQMVQARNEIRQLLAVPPGTPSQAVVDGLIRASEAFDAGNTAAAEAALPASVFTLGPTRTAALLSNLPYLPQANVAAQQANLAIMSGCGFAFGGSNCG